MAFAFIGSLQTLWPFSLFKFDDLKASDELVRKLSVPETTKRFVFAVRIPESQSVIYILSAQNLSERSAVDADCLIREIRPDVVVAQVGNSALSEIQSEEDELGRGDISFPIPTSSFEVLRRCFVDKANKQKYENLAGNLVLREIFGICFHGHFLAAKKAAREVGSSFVALESPFVIASSLDNSSGQVVGDKVQGLVSSLVSQTVTPVVLSSSRRFAINNDIQSGTLKLLSSHMKILDTKLWPSSSISELRLKEVPAIDNYDIPPFAQFIYPLLLDLHNIFTDLPSIGRALAYARKIFSDVNKGEVVDTQIVSEIYTFRVAVEGLRIALNNAGRLPISKIRKSNAPKVDFTELPVDEKSHALLAQALQMCAGKFKTVVAVVDASSIMGIREHWDTPVPPEVKSLVKEFVSNCEGDGGTSNNTIVKRLFSDNPAVAVGAGATAVLTVSSLPKVFPVSTFMKLVTFKVPTSLKLVLTQTQKAMAIALSKTLPSKVVAPGLASSGANTTSIFKAVASAEKIRAVTHSVIASAEKTSFSAMRTAFYEIMRKRRVRPIGSLPWATFGSSITVCAGLVLYGDRIECAAESLPAAPSIASLGRGIQGLCQASQAARQREGNRIQKSIESLMYRLKKVMIQ